ncbi:MAG: aminotransferase class I/II-fold pyridoxal phosphate-dependent enzyme, partial [Candidatus Poseidoniaceae archaeon]|nr:aminotransferase class I/II-fold pyridoxal phosphate-dependent enzyme [Candidatus Poseidoniaceae archaeon]
YVCHGVTEALQIVFQATLEEGHQVLAPGPHYPPYMAYPQMYGAETIEYELKSEDGWSLNFDDIESKMNDEVRLFVLINPNNPTGSVAGSGELMRLISILEKWPNCILIADEIYDGLDFSGRQVSAASLSKTVPVLTMNGVSKVYYAPGWRIGYMAIHDPISSLVAVRDGIERILRSRLCASTPAQLGYLAGLEQDRSWMKKYCETVKERRDVCLSRISEIEGLEVQNPEGAFYMFVKLTDQKWSNDDKAFVLQLLHEQHVLVVHGSGFSSEKGKGHFRLVFLPDVETLHTAFDRIDSFLQKHRIV